METSSADFVKKNPILLELTALDQRSKFIEFSLSDRVGRVISRNVRDPLRGKLWHYYPGFSRKPDFFLSFKAKFHTDSGKPNIIKIY